MSKMSMFVGDSHGSSKRCRPSICLFLTCFFFFSEVTAFGVDWFHHEGATFRLLNPQSVVSAGQYVCQTEICTSEANRMKEYMDLKGDPCIDFYQFACGGFTEKYRDAYDTVNIVTLTQQRIIEQVVELLTDDDVPESFKISQNFYKSCLDLDSDIKNAIPEMMEILEEAGGFPLLEGNSWDPDRFDILGSAPGQTINPMKYMLFELRVGRDYSGSEEGRKLLTLSLPHVQLPTTALLEDGLDSEIVNQTFTTLIRFAEYLGADSEAATEAYLELLEYQTKLAEINYNCSYDSKIMTVQELSEFVPSIPWLDYFRSILPDTFNIDVNEPIQLLHFSCLPEIVELIQNTPKRVMANYMGTAMTAGTVSILQSVGLKIPKFLMPERWEGEFVDLPRSEICAKHMIEVFDSFVGPLHAANYFDEENNKQLREVLTNVKSAAQSIIESSTSLDPGTRNLLLGWSSNYTMNVPTPAEIGTPSESVQEMVAQLNISPNSFLRNIIEALETYTRWTFTSMHLSDEERHALEPGRWINNYWTYGWSKLDVPVGYQQAPLIDKNRPAYLNYGIMGSIFAKKLMENMFDSNLWSLNKEPFEDNAQCLNDQESSDNKTFLLEGMSLDRLSFAGGVTIDAVFTAYSRWVEENAAEGALPELGLNKNQILWLAGGQTMCNKFKEGSWEEYPVGATLNSVMKNSEGFAKDFGCASGSPMNPADKCVVW